MDKKKRIVLAVLATIVVLALFGVYQYNATYVTVGSNRYLRSSERLDLREVPLANGEYAKLQAELPECEILWQPNFQGQRYPLNTTLLNAAVLTEEDINDLSYFPELKTLNAAGCTDYDNILALRQQLPEVEVLYSLTLNGREYRHNTTYARLNDGTVADGEYLLKYLPELESMFFAGTIPELEELQALEAAHPGVHIDWEIAFHGLTISTNAPTVDLTGIRLTRALPVKNLLDQLHNVERVILCDTGLPQEEVLSLYENYPEVTFVWDMELFGQVVRTDVRELDISGNQVTVQQVEELLPYFCSLEKVIMCDCGIDNESMAALNSRYEDILFVWYVYLGHVRVRTDITGFIPFKYGTDFYQYELYNLRYCTELVALDLGHQYVNSCEFVAFMPKLKYLVLADTEVVDLSPLKDLKNLVFLEIFITYVRDYSPLLNITSLRDLNIAWTYGDYEIIAQMPWLERVWWGGNWHPQERRDYMQEKCPNTLYEFDDGESTGSGWRQGKYYYEMREALDMFIMY